MPDTFQIEQQIFANWQYESFFLLQREAFVLIGHQFEQKDQIMGL